MKNYKTFGWLDRLSHKIAWFMGSWWGVIFHIIWWSIWFLAGWDFLALTMWLSIEAVLIGIFILMVQNRESGRGQKILEAYSQKELKDLEKDLKYAEKADYKQLELMREIRAIREKLEKIDKKIAGR